MSDVAENEHQVITLVYLGPDERPGRFLWRWDDRVLVYKSLKARVPGAVYSVEAKVTGDVISVTPSTLSYTGEMAEDAAAIQLRARDVEARNAFKRLETNTSRTSAIDETLGDLLALARKLKTYDQRFALAQYVRDQIMTVRN